MTQRSAKDAQRFVSAIRERAGVTDPKASVADVFAALDRKLSQAKAKRVKDFAASAAARRQRADDALYETAFGRQGA